MGSEDKGRRAVARHPTEEEAAWCLGVLAEAHPDAIDGTPEKMFVIDSPSGAAFYVLPKDPERLPIGAVYVTFGVLRQSEGRVKTVMFRSERGLHGDRTLPPD